MDFKIHSTNNVVEAVIKGTAPGPARLAAARGMLPLPQSDLLEILVALTNENDKELADSARETLDSQKPDEFVDLFKSEEIAPIVLAHYTEQEEVSNSLLESILANPNTPRKSIVQFARHTKKGELLEVLSLNQQLLIREKPILDAILSNSYRTPEAQRRAEEIKREFFEKERGAEQIANEFRAQGKEAAAEFIEQAEFIADLKEESPETELSLEDAILLAEHIEIPDSEIDDSWLSLEYIEQIYEETEEQRQAIASKIVGELRAEDEISGERVSMIQRILLMKMKDRVKLAMKGDREARNILIRDPNRVVSQAVINNPRITEQEVEKIAAMRTVPGDVLRQIAASRTWARNYSIMHNLARNPRTPISNVMSILSRMHLKDLKALNKNRNVSDAVRRQALRLVTAREGKR